MKLFLREHMTLIVIQCIQFVFIIGIIWLAGFHEWKILLYAFGIGILFLFAYLIYYYVTRRRLYNRLEKELITLDESLIPTDTAPISEAFDQLIQSQYKRYIEKVNDIEDAKNQHLEFIDRWVHQMKTPLSVIELTAQDLDEPDSSNIREETDRIKTGLNTVLYTARLRTIQDDFHIKPVDLEKVIHDVNQENRRFYIRNHVFPKFENKGHITMVETDEKWLLFIVGQLVQNAVKYSAGKSNEIIISLYKRATEEIVLEVKDFGIGIPDFDQKRIFQPFFTGENGRKYRESTGMGLYLVKEVVNYLGHDIEVDSKVGEGTTFKLIFNVIETIT
ncbi:MAG TPA: sensor histidine kinase [Cerasibacillus sp.]|uniref:sensor histidine kinase n=1 Tax=Cerasibacillus sp. TaxID=2498711 RepID=UPI002F3FEDD7